MPLAETISMEWEGQKMGIHYSERGKWYFACECGNCGHQYEDCSTAIEEAILHAENHG